LTYGELAFDRVVYTFLHLEHLEGHTASITPKGPTTMKQTKAFSSFHENSDCKAAVKVNS